MNGWCLQVGGGPTGVEIAAGAYVICYILSCTPLLEYTVMVHAPGVLAALFALITADRTNCDSQRCTISLTRTCCPASHT